MERERLGSFHPKPYGHTAWQRAPTVPPSGSDSARTTGRATAGMTGSCRGTPDIRALLCGWITVCVCVCVSVCVSSVWVCRHVHSLRFAHLLSEKTHIRADLEASQCCGVALWLALLLFCVPFVFLYIYIYFWEHRRHIILLSFRPCKYFKHWITLGFHDALKHFWTCTITNHPSFLFVCVYYC